MRGESQSRGVRVQTRLGRSPVRRAEGAAAIASRRTSVEPLASRLEDHHAESETTTLENANGEAPHARCAPRRRPERVPALSRAETAAPRLRQLRLLSRPPSPGRGRRIEIWNSEFGIWQSATWSLARIPDSKFQIPN